MFDKIERERANMTDPQRVKYESMQISDPDRIKQIDKMLFKAYT